MPNAAARFPREGRSLAGLRVQLRKERAGDAERGYALRARWGGGGDRGLDSEGSDGRSIEEAPSAAAQSGFGEIVCVGPPGLSRACAE